MADNGPIVDWCAVAPASGFLSRKKNLTAIVSLEVVIQGSDGDAVRALVKTIGTYRLPAMDDGQPDPCHVSALLHFAMSSNVEGNIAVAVWGFAQVGTIARTAFGSEPVVSLHPVSAPVVRRVRDQFKGNC